MITRRVRITLPKEVVDEIDELVGSKSRSAFLAELASREIKRRRLLDLFETQEPIWRSEDHPELKEGAAEWVRKMRSGSPI